ncbi:MAG: hypothetical protein J6S01_10005 [Bacteroidales bacterium]|nr:hypothetical protein [Bacteroidales bacterium]
MKKVTQMKNKNEIPLSVKRKTALKNKNRFMASQRAVISHKSLLDDSAFVKTIDKTVSSGVISARNAGIPYTIVKGTDVLRVESGVSIKIGEISNMDVRCVKKSFRIK